MHAAGARHGEEQDRCSPAESRMGTESSVAAFIKSHFTKLTFVTHRSKLFLSLLLTCFANMPQDVAYQCRAAARSFQLRPRKGRQNGEGRKQALNAAQGAAARCLAAHICGGVPRDCVGTVDRALSSPQKPPAAFLASPPRAFSVFGTFFGELRSRFYPYATL